MKVEVYGADHSPWVQAVLLGLHEKGIDYVLRTTPPWTVLKTWGVWMPAISIDGGPWEKESSEILVKLGFKPMGERDLSEVRHAWRGVLHRTDNPFNFFSGFSRCGEVSGSWVRRTIRNFLRSFVTFYMFSVISFSKLTGRAKDPEDFGYQYLYWENVIENSAGHFMAGHSPDSQDFMLFGILQCHASVPVPPLEPLVDDDRFSGLRSWVAAMHERFASYPHLYSGPYFEPRLDVPVPATFFQRCVFYVGLVVMFGLFPITLPGVFYLASKAPR